MTGQTRDTKVPDRPETVASFRLYVEDRDRLRAAAEAEHRTLSGELRRMVEERFRSSDLLGKDAA